MQDLLTASQVQDMFDVDRSTIYRMAGDGRLPAVKIGRQWRFPSDAINRLVALPDLDRDRVVRFEPDADLVERLLELTADALGVMMVMTDLEGNALSQIVNPCPRFEAAEDDPELIRRCADEWRLMAENTDPRSGFHRGPLGFLCARAFVRGGGQPKAMVLAGGIAPTVKRTQPTCTCSPQSSVAA